MKKGILRFSVPFFLPFQIGVDSSRIIENISLFVHIEDIQLQLDEYRQSVLLINIVYLT